MDTNYTAESNTAEDTEEMRAIKQMFQKLLDTVANATRLAGEVESLRKEVRQMHGDLEYLRSRNKELDEQVAAVRGQRDGALARAAELERQVSVQNDEVFSLRQQGENLVAENQLLNEEVERLQGQIRSIRAVFEPREVPKDAAAQPRAETGQFQPKEAAETEPLPDPSQSDSEPHLSDSKLADIGVTRYPRSWPHN